MSVPYCPSVAHAPNKTTFAELNYLRQYFDDPNNPAPINSITSADIYEYLEWRIHAKIRANREISLVFRYLQLGTKMGLYKQS